MNLTILVISSAPKTVASEIKIQELSCCKWLHFQLIFPSDTSTKSYFLSLTTVIYKNLLYQSVNNGHVTCQVALNFGKTAPNIWLRNPKFLFKIGLTCPKRTRNGINIVRIGLNQFSYRIEKVTGHLTKGHNVTRCVFQDIFWSGFFASEQKIVLQRF